MDEESGVIREQVLWEAGRLWDPDPDDVVAGFKIAIEDLHRLGITTIHDIVEPNNFETYVRGVSEAGAPLRIDALVHANPRHIDYYRRKCEESSAADFRVVGIKCFLDGSLGGPHGGAQRGLQRRPGMGHSAHAQGSVPRARR